MTNDGNDDHHDHDDNGDDDDDDDNDNAYVHDGDDDREDEGDDDNADEGDDDREDERDRDVLMRTMMIEMMVIAIMMNLDDYDHDGILQNLYTQSFKSSCFKHRVKEA